MLALDPVTGPSLQTRVQGTGKDGAIFTQALWRWVLGAREDLDGLLAALDLLYLSLGQGDPLPNGLQLAPAQLYSLGDPIKEKCPDWGLLQVLRPLHTSASSTPEPCQAVFSPHPWSLPTVLVLVRCT